MIQFPPVVLQAGGKGERLASVSQRLPKVLVPVQGVPMLERLIRQLADEGAQRFVIVTGHCAGQVEEHVRAINGLRMGTSFTFLRETEPRGNMGAIADLTYLNETVLFAFGDLFTSLSFRELWERHRSQGNDITLTSHFETHRLQLGHLIVEEDVVTDYREKPEYQFLICSGICAIEPVVLRCLPTSGPIGMNKVVLTALANGLRVRHWTHGAFWMDVNTPELLATANQIKFEEPLGKETVNAGD